MAACVLVPVGDHPVCDEWVMARAGEAAEALVVAPLDTYQGVFRDVHVGDLLHLFARPEDLKLIEIYYRRVE